MARVMLLAQESAHEISFPKVLSLVVGLTNNNILE
jgi:hypothetical protein